MKLEKPSPSELGEWKDTTEYGACRGKNRGSSKGNASGVKLLLPELKKAREEVLMSVQNALSLGIAATVASGNDEFTLPPATPRLTRNWLEQCLTNELVSG